MMCEMILSGSAAQLKADRRMHENEVGVNIAMFEGSDEVDDFYTSKSTLQRGSMPGSAEGPKSTLQRSSMPGSAEEPVRATASPQRGTMPGG